MLTPLTFFYSSYFKLFAMGLAPLLGWMDGRPTRGHLVVLHTRISPVFWPGEAWELSAPHQQVCPQVLWESVRPTVFWFLVAQELPSHPPKHVLAS